MHRSGPRVVFIAGLEHSGTTLVNYYASQKGKATGVGEVYTLLDDSARVSFFSRWGKFDDAHRCSCGARHSDCPVWGPPMADIAARPQRNTSARYRDFLAKFDGDSILVDSSKSINALKILSGLRVQNVISDLRVILLVKDARSFVTSMKYVRKLNFIKQYLAFNWWCKINVQTLSYLREEEINFRLLRYEDIFRDTRAFHEFISKFVWGEEKLKYSDSIVSHIGAGNKKFINSNDKTIKYDDRWKMEWKIRAMYRAHIRAQRLSSEFCRVCDSCQRVED